MKFSAAILTISDRATLGIYEDKSGKVIIDLLEDMNFAVNKYEVIADNYKSIREKLIEYSDDEISLIITSGGTGFSKKDLTAEATLSVIEKQTPGINELMRYEGAKITPLAYLSSSVSGIRKDSLIINFPGSPKACKENFEIIRPILIHALNIIAGETNH
ncbi:molybdenum cofactor biosynthesis protein B [uncultured Anaerococcus sp.]|uniref:MogA/MoaB family molybdenum cofactor biosynthesis protein n=1 Tax=uncultured Anaerococcus sp. TaxID=293428 RepID=UPI00262B6E65|nr:MogA/MoaB family molybdenum cofactor biosynthesis protein [uncultured Anaerococcus sp.]